MSEIQVNRKGLDTVKTSLSVSEVMGVKRRGNELVTLYALALAEDGLTRSEAIELTSLKWTTQHDVLVRLQLLGLVTRMEVKCGELGKPARGRPLVVWHIKDELQGLKDRFTRLTAKQLVELALKAPDEKAEFVSYLVKYLVGGRP